MRNFYLFTVVGLTALGASALSKADLPDRPQIKSDGFVMRLMEALNGKLEPKPRPDTTVVARVDLTQKPLQRKSYSFDVALKTGQKMTVKVTGDRYDLQHYLKVTLTQAFSEKEALNLESARTLVADAARNAPVILLGHSVTQPSPTQLTVDLKDLPLKKVNVQGPKDKATAAVLSMIQTNLDNQPFIARYAVQNLIKNLQALPGYQGTKVIIAPDAKNESVILTVQLKKAEEHHIGYLFKNDLSTKVGPLNNTLSFSANNAFTDHDNLNLYTILSQEPKNLWGMGMNYNYLLSDSGIRHGIMVNRFDVDPEGLDANRNLSTKNATYATYLMFPLYRDLTDEVILTTTLEHKRGSTNAPGLRVIRVTDIVGQFDISSSATKAKSIQTNFIASLKYNFKDTWDGKNGLKLNYVKGLGLTIDKARDGARSNLSAWSILLGYMRKQNLGAGFAITPSVDMQWASAKAGPNQNYSFGGRAIERAYKNHAVQGQSGMRTGMQVSFMDFIYAYYSYGRIKNHINAIGTRKEEATSTGVGMTVPLFQYVLANVEYAIPLKRRTLYADGKHRNKLFVSVGGRWKF